MVQVRELQRVTEEEYWRIVTDQIPVTLLGVKPHSKATDITFSIGSAALASDGRRSEEHTSELQSRPHLVCRLLLEKKKKSTAAMRRRLLFSYSNSPATI